jgi:TatD DNase family protein
LSFGKELLKENSKIVGILPEIPLNYIFFETDDSDIIIDNIYKSAAAILNIGVEELGEKIEDNFNKIF